MRIDPYSGETVPATLGEYRDICQVMGMENNAAVALLDKKIMESERGRDALVFQADSQMCQLLMPMMIQEATAEPEPHG